MSSFCFLDAVGRPLLYYSKRSFYFFIFGNSLFLNHSPSEWFYITKSLSPSSGTGDHEYVLYHINQLHSTSIFARLVYGLPGEFCRFLWFFGAGRSCRIVTDERSGENSFIFSFSRRSGVRRWKNIPLIMWNVVSSTITASWFYTMKRLTICGKCRDTASTKYP